MKSVPDYTRSNDGKYRATIKLSHRIPKEDVQWVAEKLGVSESVALKEIKGLLKNKLSEVWHFHTYVVQIKELTLISVDDTDQYKEEDDCEVYE
jgi:hypothetical protein